MSLRPQFGAFRIEELRRLFGSGDQGVSAIVSKAYAEQVAEDQDDQAEAEQVIRAIVSGQPAPEVEDDIWQSVMACFVDQTQAPKYSESLFWEAFMTRLNEVQSVAAPPVAQLLGYLENGRPLVGSRTESSWSYYAFFTNEEAGQIFSLIQSVAALRTEYDFAGAVDWMNQVTKAGDDVWFVAG